MTTILLLDTTKVPHPSAKTKHPVWINEILPYTDSLYCAASVCVEVNHTGTVAQTQETY